LARAKKYSVSRRQHLLLILRRQRKTMGAHTSTRRTSDRPAKAKERQHLKNNLKRVRSGKKLDGLEHSVHAVVVRPPSSPFKKGAVCTRISHCIFF
jgi:hypothetical protein